MTQPTQAPPVCYRHPGRTTYVSCVRCGRPICPDCMRPASVGFQCPEEESGPRVRTVRDPQSIGWLLRQAPVTAALIAINVAVFLVGVATGSSFTTSAIGGFEAHLVQSSLPVASGQWYRIVTAMFAHYGIIHIGLNMLTLYFVGVPLERSIGRVRFLALYLVCGIGGGVATYLFASVGSQVGDGVFAISQSAGASGAIFGLFGAFAVLARRTRAVQLGPILGTIGINLVLTFSIPDISITDHLGGLAVGAVLGTVLAIDRRVLPGRARTRRLVIETGAFVVVLALAVGLFAYRTHQLRDRYDLRGPVSVAAAPAVVRPPARG